MPSSPKENILSHDDPTCQGKIFHTIRQGHGMGLGYGESPYNKVIACPHVVVEPPGYGQGMPPYCREGPKERPWHALMSRERALGGKAMAFLMAQLSPQGKAMVCSQVHG